MNLPRVLVLSSPFCEYGGGGVTICNLFRGWPREKLANMYWEPPTDGSVSGLTYVLGEQETEERLPPFRRKSPHQSGPVSLPVDFKAQFGRSAVQRSGFLRNSYAGFVRRFGLNNIEKRIRVSRKLIDWVNEFDPDVIYVQFSMLYLLHFVEELQHTFSRPFVIHMMDDWVLSAPSETIFPAFWSRKLDTLFRRIVDASAIRLAICDGMAREYEKRYGAPFIGFHNPVDLSAWTPYTRKDVAYEGPCRVLYAGSVNFFILGALLDVANAIQTLRGEGLDIELHIYSSNLVSANAQVTIEKLQKMEGVEKHPGVPFKEMPKLLASHEVLVIPFDFSEKSRVFTRFSMPTKTSEYMISGSPMLVYAPAESSLAEYSQSEGFAEVVSERNGGMLAGALRRLATDNERRASLSAKAVELAQTRHDAAVVRRDFAEILQQATE